MNPLDSASTTEGRPILIYDGHCGFCEIWVNYWRSVTGERVGYSSSQEVAEQYPEISVEQFRRSVWLVYPNGRRVSGAAAAFELMAHAPGKAWPLWLYNHFPGFGIVTELSYRIIAEHRSFFYWITRILWGKQVEPASYRWSRWLFLRGLAVVYLIAFISLLPQISGLIGHNGILPASDFLSQVRSEIGSRGYTVLPTLVWLNSSDTFLHAICWAGGTISVALLIGILPIPSLIALYILYLSIVMIGQDFLSFQWDILLLESGFAAILFAPAGFWPRYDKAPPHIGRWVLRFLAFRLMLESGLVKLLSGDAAWRNLTALNFHYETQPLPTPLAWYAHQLSPGFQKFSVAMVFVVELGVPFLFFMPRRLRIIGAWTTIVFQLLIAAMGNYTFFNLLAILLCVSLFDDKHLRRFIPSRFRRIEETDPNGPVRRHWRWLRIAAGIAIITIGIFQVLRMFDVPQTLPEPLSSLNHEAEVFNIVNHYGLFAVMTTSRLEIIIEGSDDGQEWKAYDFKFKPEDVHQSPRWVAPYQPRLDWQMWFAALSDYRNAPWFSKFMLRLLEGSPVVLRLLKTNPFPNHPPRFVRADIYEYHFSDFASRRATGAWWTSKYLGAYFPQVSHR